MAVHGGAYLIVWVKYIKKFPGEWEEYWPKAIPIAAVCAALSCLGFIIAMWPIWGFLSLPIMFFLLMGGIQSAHFNTAMIAPLWNHSYAKLRREQFDPSNISARARTRSVARVTETRQRPCRCRRRIVLRPLWCFIRRRKPWVRLH